MPKGIKFGCLTFIEHFIQKVSLPNSFFRLNHTLSLDSLYLKTAHMHIRHTFTSTFVGSCVNRRLSGPALLSRSSSWWLISKPCFNVFWFRSHDRFITMTFHLMVIDVKTDSVWYLISSVEGLMRFREVFWLSRCLLWMMTHDLMHDTQSDSTGVSLKLPFLCG